MKNLPLFDETPPIHSDFDAESGIVLHHGEAHTFLQSLPSDLVQLVVTSPPYNLGKDYEEKRPLEHYLAEQRPILEQLYRVLSPHGSVCWQVGNYVEDGEVFPLDMFYYPLFKQLGFQLRNRVIWHFEHGLHTQKRFSGRYETLLWFSKTDDYLFNLDPVRVPAKYPGKRHYKGDKKGELSGNPKGKNPSDVWQTLMNDWDSLFWDIPNVKSNHVEKADHPCQFPIELVERCVLALSTEGDWVLDPYAGVGSALIAALRHDRRAVGCDKEADYVQLATERIQAHYGGTLKVRPMGKPVHQPTGREKVAQVPDEWKTGALE
jgi:DNA modification methylase